MDMLQVASSLKSVSRGVGPDVQIRPTRSHACFSARNAVPSACVYLRALTVTSNFAPATIIGRPREADPNARDLICITLFIRSDNICSYVYMNINNCEIYI
ncbi:hypothetical protein Ancab_031091 [Ancistrocladus abbreviatus]